MKQEDMNEEHKIWGKQTWIPIVLIYFMSLQIRFLLFNCPQETCNIELFLFCATKNI